MGWLDHKVSVGNCISATFTSLQNRILQIRGGLAPVGPVRHPVPQLHPLVVILLGLHHLGVRPVRRLPLLDADDSLGRRLCHPDRGGDEPDDHADGDRLDAGGRLALVKPAFKLNKADLGEEDENNLKAGCVFINL